MREVTRISSKGQVVIPAWVRERLRIGPGEEFHVEVGPEPDPVVILRRTRPPAMDERLERGYEWLERTGTDLVEALHAERHAARRREKATRRA
jgi:AbrB family looped-hinge helix DNA binding protein